MEKSIEKKYQTWLDKTKNDKFAQEDLLSIKDNESLITDRFYKDLEFGTAGLRGKLGYGTNSMNPYVVRKATQGLANYLNKHFENPSCVIAYDSRLFSKEFASETAKVLAANNVKVYLFKELAPVPVLSFSVRHLNTSSGIVITASHNPKEYNGYKVYGADGAQINIEVANEVLSNINALDYFDDIKIMDLDDAIDNGLVTMVYEDLFDAFIASTMKTSIEREDEKIAKIVYTPLHGAGLKFVTKVLDLDGFKNVHVVEEQRLPDGNFPTASYPNPEMREALTLGIRDLEALDYDALIATDPDSDRVGVAVKDHDNVVVLTGNEIGILLFDFVYQARVEKKTLPLNPVLVKTIVSTDLVNIIAAKRHVDVVEVLTGFKFIGEQIKLLDQKGERDRYIFGFEESCGYLTNQDVRDKDAVNACLLVAEMVNHYKKQGLTLIDRMNQIYDEFGHYVTKTVSYAFEGQAGKEKIDSLMSFFRNKENDKVFDDLIGKYDYLYQEGSYDLEGVKYNLPKSDVLKFHFKDHSTLTIRPSGTEPKIKFYYFIKVPSSLDLEATVVSILSNLK